MVALVVPPFLKLPELEVSENNVKNNIGGAPFRKPVVVDTVSVATAIEPQKRWTSARVFIKKQQQAAAAELKVIKDSEQRKTKHLTGNAVTEDAATTEPFMVTLTPVKR